MNGLTIGAGPACGGIVMAGGDVVAKGETLGED